MYQHVLCKRKKLLRGACKYSTWSSASVPPPGFAHLTLKQNLKTNHTQRLLFVLAFFLKCNDDLFHELINSSI